MGLRNRFSNSSVSKSLDLLTPRDRSKVFLVIVAQIFMSFLDLVGVAIIGVIGALAINGVQSRTPGDRVSWLLETLGFQDLTLQQQVAFLGTIAAVLLLTRTLASIFVTRRILLFLSYRAAHITKSLIEKLLSQPMLLVQSKSSQETLYALTSGVSAITLRIIGGFISLIADASLLIVMGAGLLFLNPIVAISSLMVFVAVGVVLHWLMHTRAAVLGTKESMLNIASNEKVIEVLETYREAVVRNRRSYYAQEIGKIRFELSDTLAEISFFPNVGKYVIEITVLLGAFILAGVQFWLQDASHAVATLAVFLAAGTRIAPAVLRIQQGVVMINGAAGASVATFDLISRLKNSHVELDSDSDVHTSHTGFAGTLSLSDVTFTYPNSSRSAVSDANFNVDEGEFVAVVGPSGAGKTTLIDLVLGILDPERGDIKLSGGDPLGTIRRWPGAIAYVPQDALIVKGSISNNIKLGFPDNPETDELVWDALRESKFDHFVEGLPGKLEYQVGERGSKLSGGQRQRLAISRALFTKPKFLVLDEATSALDAQTEAELSSAIVALKGKTTVLMIAHRLSTVLAADKLIYIDGGKIVSIGTFNEVRASVPNFDKQAQLMGL